MPKTKKPKKEKVAKKTEKVEKAEKPKKKITKKPVVKEEIEKPDVKTYPKLEKYYEGVGRRKTAVARVRLWTKGDKVFTVNNEPLEKHFSTVILQQIAKDSLQIMKCLDQFGVSAVAKGGGLNAQAEAIRHGIARALVLFNPDFRKRLKKAGFLIRDPRMKERKKPGLKRARKAPQWQKR